jgi:transposase
MDREHVTIKARRSQQDYSLAFKLTIVDEIEKGYINYRQAQSKYGVQGHATVLRWLRRYGRLNWYGGNNMKCTETPYKKIKELEKRIKELEIEKEVLNRTIDIADEKFETNIRKKYLALSLEAIKRQSKQV